MNRFFWKLLAVVAALFGTCGIHTPVHAQNSNKIDLAEVTQRLTQWRSSLINLHIVYEMRTLATTTDKPLTEWPIPEDPESGRQFLRKEWIWADHGLDLFATFSPGQKSGNPIVVEVFNGPKKVSFRASYKPTKDAEVLAQLTLRGLGTGKPTSNFERIPMAGLYWPGGATWLPELLAQWNWTLEGIEEIDHSSCARIVARDPWFTDIDWRHILWLDLGHDCLVRRHLGPSIPERRAGRDFLVDEFQQMENGHWFPKRGRYQMEDQPYVNQSWEVTEVAVNESLNLSRFDPPAPIVGTIVDDGNGRVFTQGATVEVQTLGSPQSTSARSISQQAPAHSATPPAFRWMWWSASLLLASLVFLVTGYFLWHRT